MYASESVDLCGMSYLLIVLATALLAADVELVTARAVSDSFRNLELLKIPEKKKKKNILRCISEQG